MSCSLDRAPGHLGRVPTLLALFALGGCAGSTATGSPEPPTPVDPVTQIEEARATLASHPDDVNAWFRLGAGWQTRADETPSSQAAAYRDSARVAFEELLERDPDNVKGLVHHGLVLEDLNRHSEALLAYQKATEKAPDDPLPYINLGSLLYFQYRKTYEAKQALTRALELDPGNADAHFNLGVLFADAKLYREAAVEWSQVIEHDPDGPASQLARENLDRIQPVLDLESSAP